MGLFSLFKKNKKEKVWDKTMQVQFCFRADTLTVGHVLDLMDRCSDFTVSAVSRERDFEVLTAARRNELKNADKETNAQLFADALVFLDQDNKTKVMIEKFPKSDFQVVYWNFNAMQFLESVIFKEMIAKPELIVAYCYNTQDYWEQNTYHTHFEDIAGNPGRFYIINSVTLVSAWKSWFGRNFYEIIAKEKIKQFDKAFSIVEIDNGVTCVTLYSNHEDFNNAESRQIQFSFREWMGYKKLKEQEG